MQENQTENEQKEVVENVVETAEEKEELEQENSPESNEQEDYKEKFLYLAAELENYKRRSEKEKQSLLKYGSEKVLSELLEVVDNLERTFDAVKEDEDEKLKNVSVGIDMVIKQFLAVLSKSGLEVVETEGKSFDPNFHEAMSAQEVEGKKEGEIIQVYQKGYILNGRLLRPAKVIVAK